MCVSNLENTMYHYPLPPGCEPIQCNTIFSFFSFCSRHAHYSSCLTLINNHSSFSFTCKVSDITRLFYSVVFFYMLCCHEIEYISSACNAIVWWPIIHSLVVGTLPATMRYLFQVGSTTRWVHAFVSFISTQTGIVACYADINSVHMHNYLSENQKIGEANNSKFYMSNMHDMSQKHALIKLIWTIFSISVFKDMICTNVTE